jgi:hypothetical protein
VDAGPGRVLPSAPINLAALGRVRALWSMERFYLAVPTGSATVNDRVLVYDTQHHWWSLYDVPAAALAAFRSGDRPRCTSATRARCRSASGGSRSPRHRPGRGDHVALALGLGRLRLDAGQDDPRDEAVGHGRGGRLALDGLLTQPAVSIDTRFTPVGEAWTYAALAVRGGTYADLATDFTNYTGLAANSPRLPVIDDALLRYATRGIVFSTQFSNSPLAPTWSVHRVARHLREIREASVNAT